MAIWFITGASRGLGAEIARAALDGGDDVAVAVRDPGKLPDDIKHRVFAVALDVTRSADIPVAVQSVVDHFGGIEVLVNNAGRGLLGALGSATTTAPRLTTGLTRSTPPITTSSATPPRVLR
jgi:NAD(P)-dependent dehydrogenase (short-subunit alcohol dehydrogenase family)